MRRSYYPRKQSLPIVNYRANLQITSPEVRIVDDQDQNLGVMPLAKALELARGKGLDLIEVSPKAVPPVVRMARYGQFKYEQEKKIKQQKAKQKKVETKGIRLSFRIGAHDLDVRREQALRFLTDRNKVRIELPLSGRERQFRDKGREIIQQFVASLGENVAIEEQISWQFGKLAMTICAK